MTTALLPSSPPASPPAPPLVGLNTVADLIHRLGDIPPHRIKLHPPLGSATVADLAADGHCELVDGTLVEKAMGFRESILAMTLGRFLQDFVAARNLGFVTGEQGGMEITLALVRMPDVAFVSWDRLPGRRMPDAAYPPVVPDLAVEVLSLGNTRAEMARKRQEYFDAGVSLVWMIDPPTRTATVFTAVDQSRTFTEADTLDGGSVLPGFVLALRELFGELDRHG